MSIEAFAHFLHENPEVAKEVADCQNYNEVAEIAKANNFNVVVGFSFAVAPPLGPAFGAAGHVLGAGAREAPASAATSSQGNKANIQIGGG